MNISRIKKKIEAALKDETKTRRLANAIRATSRQAGVPCTESQAKAALKFAKEYVDHVPFYLEQAVKGAPSFGLSKEMNQMLAEIEAYWLAEDDLISDRLGLLGLLDDAYASLLLLQSVSDFCAARWGRPILAQNLTPANLSMRQFINQSIALQIEQRVGVTIANSLFAQALEQIAASGWSFGGVDTSWDPMWGRASINEIVDARLGAMGVVK
jgi:hypothetical protein